MMRFRILCFVWLISHSLLTESIYADRDWNNELRCKDCPTGPQGPAGTNPPAAYGFFITQGRPTPTTVPPGGIVPLQQSVVQNNVTFSPSSVTINSTGIYQITYFVGAGISDPNPGTANSAVVGLHSGAGLIIGSKVFQNISQSNADTFYHDPLYGEVITRLQSGDSVFLLNDGTSTISIDNGAAPEAPSVSLIIVKIGD